MSHLADAVALAEKGYAVFPVWGIDSATGKCLCGGKSSCGADGENAGKHPITPRGLTEATTRVTQVRVWWAKYPDANIGIATGEVSGIVVLDVDGQKGFSALAGRALPTTPSVTTGRVDGGTHFYFAHPGGRVKNSVGKLGTGLDIRGDGGYVIAPPSRHKSGNVYQWGESLDTPLAELPKWILTKIDEASSGFDNSQDGEIIEKGGRDVYLTSLAGSMRKRGMPESAIFAALWATNNERCSPPLSEEDIKRIAHSIGTRAYDSQNTPNIAYTILDSALGDVVPSEDCRAAPHTDVGNAEAFVSLYGDRFRYDHTRKRWLVWPVGGSAWLEDENEAHKRGFIATLRARYFLANSIEDDAERDALEKWARKCESGQYIATSLRVAQSMTNIATQATQYDTDPYLLNFLNGTLNLRDLVFSEPRQSDYLTRRCPIEFDLSATAPEWEKFISVVFRGNQELIDYVQRALGYCLTGDTKEHAFFIAYGGGANGKSTLLTTLGRVLGNYSTVTAFRTFDADNRNEYGNDLAALRGTRFVAAIESEQNKRLAEARVKMVTGGDKISCRYLYGEFFEMLPQFKVWLAVNHKPIIRGTDNGIWRRIHLIPFTQTFGDKPGELPMNKDMELILARELPGIMNWLINGYLAWKRDGLRPPASVVEATREYRAESDYVAQWLELRCDTTDAGAKLKAIEGYQDFRQYLTDIGETQERNIPSLKVWGTGMADKGFQKSREVSGFFYEGIRLAPVRVFEGKGI